MNQNLRESATHGTSDFPFALYHMQKIRYPFSVSLHWHDEVEIIYVERGTLHLTIDKTSCIGHGGDIFMVNSQEIHEMSVTDTDTVYYTILFPLSSLVFLNMDQITTKYLLPLADKKLRFTTVLSGTAAYPAVHKDLLGLIDVYQEKTEGYMLKIRILLLDILYAFFACGQMSDTHRESRYSKMHREILGYINENYLGEISLEAIAAQFHMVPKYFSRYFKNTFHSTLTDYVNHLRLERAVDLLRNTDLSVTEVALHSGFNSCSYFNKKFKAAFGKSPSAYRN